MASAKQLSSEWVIVNEDDKIKQPFTPSMSLPFGWERWVSQPLMVLHSAEYFKKYILFIWLSWVLDAIAACRVLVAAHKLPICGAQA